jgi:hypothetical protein
MASTLLPLLLEAACRASHARLAPGGDDAAACVVDAAKGCYLEAQTAKGYRGSCPEKGGKCGRCLGFFVGAQYNGATSRENCACLCHQHGFDLAGVENGNNCYCGKDATFPSKICAGATTAGCGVACNANRSQTCGGKHRMEVFGFSCAAACKVALKPDPPRPPPPPSPPPPGCRPAMGMKCGLPHWTPAVHTTPACYEKGGAHDIAGALWHEPTKTWHLMAGCWSVGGWQHMTSKNLVHWTTQGAPRGFGGTGGLVHNDDGSIVAYAMDGGGLHFWQATDEHATNWTESATTFKACCNDPIVWRDAGVWYAITAQHGDVRPDHRGPNFGDETFFSSKHLIGPEADWKPLPDWFVDKGSLLVPGHNMTHEFVSPDFFQNITGDSTNTAAVFLTSTYGPLADAWQNVSGNTLYNYALFFIGSQPGGAGTPFVPKRTTAVDWSPFSPHAATPGGLDVATGWGPTQYGCCPKTVADSPALADGRTRRVMLGWMQNGCSSSSPIGIKDSSENTLTLPRDLSLAPDGSMRQRYI